MCFSQYRRRLRIWETNFGRDAGWIIERDGKLIAMLSDPRWEEMFWDSYQMKVVTDDPILHRALWTKEFWCSREWEKLVSRSRKFNDIAPYAFPSLTPFRDGGRLVMRGLYLTIGHPWPWDWVVLWARRWLGSNYRAG